MKKSIKSLCVAAGALPLVAVMGVSSASAQPGSNCGAYPPGNAYGMRVSVNGNNVVRSVKIEKGDDVVLGARVFRNGENCSGRSVKFYVHGPGENNPDGSAKYHLSAIVPTDETGLAEANKEVKNSFRWYATYTSDNGTGTVSTRGGDRLIQAT
jgi:hypothetical protein